MGVVLYLIHHQVIFLKGNLIMETTIGYLVWCILLLFYLAGACLFFVQDRKNVNQEREQGRHTIWYRRIAFLLGWSLLAQALGQQTPGMIISLVVLHGTVLPTSPDFAYQVHNDALILFSDVFSFLFYFVSIASLIYIAWRILTKPWRDADLRRKRSS